MTPRPRQDDGRVHGVIVGCRRGDGCWLLIRRSERVAAPLQVCFPGGAVEPGEDRHAAAVREMREEIGLKVHITGEVWSHAFDDRALTLFAYLAQPAQPLQPLQPDPHEVAEVLWLTADEVRAHPDIMPRTDEVVNALETALDD